jgi:hypothetical protein
MYTFRSFFPLMVFASISVESPVWDSSERGRSQSFSCIQDPASVRDPTPYGSRDQVGDSTGARVNAGEEAHASEAIRAAWGAVYDAPSGHSRLLRLQRFAGFVDGRLRVSVPTWWEDLLLRAELRQDKRVVFPRGEFWLYQRDENGLSYRKGFTMKRSTDRFVIAIHGQQVELPDSLIRAARSTSPLDIIDAMIVDQAIYVAMGSFISSRYLLAKLDVSTGRELWRSGRSGDDDSGVSAGRDYHFFQIQQGQDGGIYVFGMRGDCSYIDGYHAEHGRRIVMFTSQK